MAATADTWASRARALRDDARSAAAYPVVLVCRFASQRGVIRQDTERWLAVMASTAPRNASYEWSLAWLIGRFPEFRSLVYHRLGRDRRGIVQSLMPLLRAVWRPMPTLYLNTTDIGPGCFILHGFSTIVAAASVGRDFWVSQQVTIGYTDLSGRPTIGDGVVIAAGAIVVGDLRIGDGAIVGAGAVVVDDVASGDTVVGVPARPVRESVEAPARASGQTGTVDR